MCNHKRNKKEGGEREHISLSEDEPNRDPNKQIKEEHPAQPKVHPTQTAAKPEHAHETEEQIQMVAGSNQQADQTETPVD